MPERLAYDEAMLFSRIRLKVQDAELKQGSVEMSTSLTAQGPVERPWGIEGGFAVVYKFRRKNGSVCALRCFRVPMSADMQFRYERIGPYFHAHAREITARFQYYDAAIVVKEQGNPANQAYPVIEMDWIEGITLVDKVHELCGMRHCAGLKDLAQQWLHILSMMKKARIAHGDLAGVNVMVRSDEKLLLIDYDGVYIPEFAGLTQVLLGQEDFQHPQMAQRTFHEHMDAFSALVIYTALIALASKPELWGTYAKINPAGKLVDNNMLFRRQDFLDPDHSPLFRDLEKLHDQHVRAMVKELKRACLQPINDVQFPFALIDPHYNEKQLLVQLKNALQADDDEQIARNWHPPLEQYPPAQQYRTRVQLAQQRLQALQDFRSALKTGQLQHILAAYNAAVLDASLSVSAEERRLLSLARDFLDAYDRNDDDAVAFADQLRQSKMTHVIFTVQQQQRLADMRRRKDAIQAIHAVLKSKNIEKIASVHSLLQHARGVKHEERQCIERARAFVQAYSRSDDDALLTAYDALEQNPYRGLFVLTQKQEERVGNAQRRKVALEQFRLALTSRSPWRLVKAYDPLLDHSSAITMDKRAQLELARMLTEALRADDDQRLLDADAALQQSAHRSFFQLTPEEMQRITLAQQRKQALLAFRAALKSKRPESIIAAYVPLLDTSKELSREEREALARAHVFVQAFASGDDEALLALDKALQRPAVGAFFQLTAQEQQRIDLAQQRAHAFATFRSVVVATPQDAQGIVDAYDGSLLAVSSSMTAELRATLQAAHDYLAMHEALKTGIQADNDDLIRHAYNPALAQRFVGISSGEQQRIDKAMLSQELEDLLNNREYEQALNMAHSIQRMTGHEISDSLLFKLRRATMRFIREQDLTQLSLHIEVRADNNYATASWQWPTSTLVQSGLLVWQTDSWPDPPSERSWSDPAWRHIWVRRKNNTLYDTQTIPIGRGSQIYVRGYAAILDTWDQEKTWRFAAGSDQTSYAQATSPQMTWRIQQFHRDNH